jgi:hypothetical protein
VVAVIRGLAPLGAACIIAAVANSCGDQPTVECTASRSTFAAKYTLVRGTGVCAEVIGETLGVQTFVPNPREPGDGMSSVAIKSGTVGDEETLGRDENPEHVPFALGKFTSLHPDAQGICHIRDMTIAEFQRGPVPTNRRLDPAIHLKHEWRNVRFLVTPAHTGVAFEADLIYTQDGCEAENKVVGISPAADCGTQLEPDVSKCSPDADRAKNFSGSGIAPEFATECLRDPTPPEPKWVKCFPAKPFPSFK